MNNLFLVGRLTNVEEVEKEGKKYTIITIANQRSYKNMNGEYEVDFIPITLYSYLASSTIEYCRKGDLIGIKGRVQGKNNIEIIADKITFLSNKKSENNE